MLGQTTVPLVGIVDTAVIGRTGDAAALAGVALGTTVINFLFWSFGFLRMGMTGMTAQAQGAGNRAEVDALLARGMTIGIGIGALLAALQVLLIPAAFAILAGGGALDVAARQFTAMRFFGAPAGLAVFAVNGWLLGLGRTRAALALQVVMNLANIGLDLLFVWHFGMGARGVGLGTSCAEWIALATGAAMVWPHLRVTGRARLFEPAAMRRLFAVNADIMIRTVALLLLFGWFANAGARLGVTALAANQVLMQAVGLVAFVLDGFAFTAESRVGHAIGGGSRADLIRAIRLTGEFSLGVAVLASLLIALFGALGVEALVTDPAVCADAIALVPLVVALPLIGMPAWLLDGIFIGATRGRALRNAGLLSTALYILTDLALRPWGAPGVWWALLASYVYRAVALGRHLPALIDSVAKRPSGP